MNDYPNLRALAQGCISGRLRDWTHLRSEATEILKEIEQLRNADKLAQKKKAPKYLEDQRKFRFD